MQQAPIHPIERERNNAVSDAFYSLEASFRAPGKVIVNFRAGDTGLLFPVKIFIHQFEGEGRGMGK